MSFIYDLSTPTTINFQHLITDPTGHRTHQLAVANATRAAMRAALKQSQPNSADNPDHYKATKVIEDYLPHLLGLMDSVEKDTLLMTHQIVFGWRSTLSSRRVRSAPRISLPTFHYELASVLLNLGFALSNTANTLLQSIGSYEYGTETDRRAGDEKLSSAADTLCRASGVFEFLSKEIIPSWENGHPDGQAHLRSARPPELSQEATSGLAQLALADAERLAIRRLLSRSRMDHHTNPGAGLPKSHPSPALLAKLELNVHQLYAGARDAFKLACGSGELSGSLRNYVNEGRQFALGCAYKWLALEAGELAGQNGEAIGWLGLAREAIKAVRSGSVIAVRQGSLKNDWARKKGKVEQEIDEIDRFLKAYEQLNRTVTFESITPPATLLARVPGGRAALQVKPYTLPSALVKDFGSYTSSGSLDWADSDDDDAPSSSKPSTVAYC